MKTRTYLFLFIALGLLSFCLQAVPAHAATGFVQGISNDAFELTTESVTLNSTTVQAGDIIAVGVFVYTQSSTISSVAAPTCVSGNFTLVNNSTTYSTKSYAAMGYGIVSTTTASCQVTATLSGTDSASGYLILDAMEITGVATTSPLDANALQAQTHPGAGTNAITSGNATTTNNGDFIFGWTAGASNGSFAPVAGTGYTAQESDPTLDQAEDKIQSSAGSTAATFTDTANGGSISYLTGIMAFKAASPTVTWIAPVNNTTVSSTAITLTASSTDTATSISNLAFYAGSYGATLASSTLIGSTSTASGNQYSVIWNTTSFANGSTTVWVLSTDANNNTASASTTMNVENPPVISNIATSTTLTTATITWNTNEGAASQVNYGVSTGYGNSVSTSTLATSTSFTLTGLAPNTIYHFMITATDAENNVATTTDATFTTVVMANSISLLNSSSTDFFLRGQYGSILGNSVSTDFSLFNNGQVLALPVMSSTDFMILSGVIKPIFEPVKPNYTLIHYQWRNDNGSETGATSATGGIEDTALTGLGQNTSIRVRTEITNGGGTVLAYTPQSFQLQYGLLSTTCSAISSWTAVGGAGAVWSMYNSSNLTDGANTTDIATSTGGVLDTNHTFIVANAGVKTTTSTVSAISVPSDSFIDMEFDVEALSSSTSGATYCFRLTNVGSATNFTYTQYPEATLSSGGQSITLTLNSSTVTLPGLTPGTAVSATTTATVSVTGASAGYTLSINRNSATSTLASGTIAFPDYTSWAPSGSSCASGQGNGTTTPGTNFSFRVASSGTTANYCSFWWGTSDAGGTALYAGVPTSSQIIVNSTSSASQNGTTVVTLIYSANAPSNQRATSYTGQVTITAIANP